MDPHPEMSVRETSLKTLKSLSPCHYHRHRCWSLRMSRLNCRQTRKGDEISPAVRCSSQSQSYPSLNLSLNLGCVLIHECQKCAANDALVDEHCGAQQCIHRVHDTLRQAHSHVVNPPDANEYVFLRILSVSYVRDGRHVAFLSTEKRALPASQTWYEETFLAWMSQWHRLMDSLSDFWTLMYSALGAAWVPISKTRATNCATSYAWVSPASSRKKNTPRVFAKRIHAAIRV